VEAVDPKERALRTDRLLLGIAVAANGILSGAALDQAIKQLPARNELGAEAFSAYSQASDLSQGVAWYATIGVGTGLLTVLTVIAGVRARRPALVRRALWVALAGTIGHLAVTAFAAPVNFSQRDAADVAELTDIQDTFAQLNVVRTGLVVIVLVALVVAVLEQLCEPVNETRSADAASR
jgi:hypothetical protein